MDFYYPGKGKNGDLPPRKDFGDKWHNKILELLPDVELFILIGKYAQGFYLKGKLKDNLTDTVRAYKEYLPKFFPIVHPSPLNIRWLKKNPWFEDEVVPTLKEMVTKIMKRWNKFFWYIKTAWQPLVFHEIQNAPSTIMDVAAVLF